MSPFSTWPAGDKLSCFPASPLKYVSENVWCENPHITLTSRSSVTESYSWAEFSEQCVVQMLISFVQLRWVNEAPICFGMSCWCSGATPTGWKCHISPLDYSSVTGEARWLCLNRIMDHVGFHYTKLAKKTLSFLQIGGEIIQTDSHSINLSMKFDRKCCGHH